MWAVKKPFGGSDHWQFGVVFCWALSASYYILRWFWDYDIASEKINPLLLCQPQMIQQNVLTWRFHQGSVSFWKKTNAGFFARKKNPHSGKLTPRWLENGPGRMNMFISVIEMGTKNPHVLLRFVGWSNPQSLENLVTFLWTTATRVPKP